MAAMTARHTYADLTISLSRLKARAEKPVAGEAAGGDATDAADGDAAKKDVVSCEVSLRFSRWDDSRDRAPVEGEAMFDLLQLRVLLSRDLNEYARVLTGSLFADPELSAAFDKYRDIAHSQKPPLMLRLRLDIAPSVAELHSVRWETLLDPKKLTRISESENVLLSRYLLSEDESVVRLRPHYALRALAVIANARDLEGTKMAIDAEAVLKNLRAALGEEIPLDHVDAGGGDTVDTLTPLLREQEYDILYVVCHGSFKGSESQLVLVDKNGESKQVSGLELVVKLNALYGTRPRLVVLASCRSAGGGETTADGAQALAALGPQLAASGVAAVVAMQGDIAMETAGAFMQTFFAEVRKHGQIDRAAAVARLAVSSRADSWMPALYMSLSKGNISWYTPGFFEDVPSFKKWESVCSHINEGAQCTPILGYGFLESLVGPIRGLARQLADDHNYPLTPHGREDLIQVLQYLAVSRDESYARLRLSKMMRAALLARHPGLEEGELKVDDLLAAASKLRWPAAAQNPYRALAKLPLPIFLTTTPDSLLTRALIEEGKRPRVDVLRWRKEPFDWPPAAAVPGEAPEDGYTPSPEKPLVFHFFGHLGQPKSLVLTQDDYFDYLIRVARMLKGTKRGGTKEKAEAAEGLPYLLSSRLVDTGLLFVGFRIDDWDFRMLSRTIWSMEGSSLLEDYTSVAVQVEPDQEGLHDVQMVRDYLQEYFVKRVKVSLYWGTAEVFVKDLLKHCQL